MADSVVVQLLTSKKVIAAMSAILTVVVVKIAGKLGVVLDADTANQISMLVSVVASAYLVSQGIADHGKEAAKVQLEAAQLAHENLKEIINTPKAS